MGRGLLILVSGLVILVGIVKKTMSDRLQQLPQRTVNYHQEMDAQNISNSLMEYGISELDNDQDWDKGFSSSDFMGAEVELQVFDYDDYQDNNPNIPADHSIKNWDRYTVLLVSTATTDRTRAVTEVAISKDSFSKYTYFTDYEPSNIYFFDDDLLNGPVHTNGELHIAGSPVFKGFVSSPNDWVGHSSYSNDPKFEGGTDFSSPVKEMPGSSKLSYLRNEGVSNGLSFNTDITLEFKSNGTVDIAKRTGGNDWNPKWGSTVNYDMDTFNGIISSSKTVYMKGTLKGQATVHSEKEVKIMGDLLYASDPLSNPNSTDILGIVSEGDVIIDDNAQNDSGNKDLEIHASIMALDESFEVQNYAWGSPRGKLKLYGGIQQKERGAVGTFGNGSVQSGYTKEYSYDERLKKMIPPFYPRESIFSQKYWKEKPIEFL